MQFVRCDLYGEMLSLNDTGRCQNNFKTTQLHLLFYMMDQKIWSQSKDIIKKIQQEVINSDTKSVYVCMKWLIFFHQLLRVARKQFVIEKILRILDLMPSLQTQSKYESYFNRKLIQPYKKYLIKLGFVLTIKMQRPSPEEREVSSNYQLFCFYNLINYSVEQFKSGIKQFTPFLQAHYPWLADYIDLIRDDLTRLYQKITHEYKRNKENLQKMIKFIDIQQMGSNLQIFKAHNNPIIINWLCMSTSSSVQQ